MVKLREIIEIERQEGTKRFVQVRITADTPTEVQAVGTDGGKVKGLRENDIITAHSTAFTANKKLLVLDSTGTWN